MQSRQHVCMLYVCLASLFQKSLYVSCGFGFVHVIYTFSFRASRDHILSMCAQNEASVCSILRELSTILATNIAFGVHNGPI